MTTTKTEVPDGGRGWAVVGGTAIINIFNQSLLSMFGLIFGSKLESIAGTTGVTTVMSVNCTISNFSGFLISPMSKYFNTKQITQIGVLLVAAGLMLSSYVKSYTRVMFGYGILTGLGLGLIASSTFLIINSYFNKNKSQAVGLAMAGTSVGQMGMPPIAAHLIQHYSYDGTILLLSALSLNGLVGSMFFYPVSKHKVLATKEKTSENDIDGSEKIVMENNFQIDENHDSKNKYVNNNVDCETNLIKREIKNRENTICDEVSIENEKLVTATTDRKSKFNEKQTVLAPELHQAQDENVENVKTCWDKFVDLFDLHILLDLSFVHIMIGLSFAYTTSISFSTFFPLFLTEDLDMTIIDASTCMSVLSFMDFIGRIIVPLITKHINITHRSIFIIGSFFLAICRSLLVLQTTFTMLVMFSAICGLARAATVINQNLVIAEYSKEAHVSSAVGLNMVCKGIFVLTIGRLLGSYKDSAHNFAACIHILDIISMGVVVFWTAELLVKKLCLRRNY